MYIADISYSLGFIWKFPDGLVGKESACNAQDMGLNPGLGRAPGEGNGSSLQYSGLENPMDRGQRSLTGYSPWVHKESDTTEQLTLTHTIVYCQNNIK